MPWLYRACRHTSALLLTTVSLTSYLSDHVYTGIESYAHLVDRVVAPLAFVSCVHSTCVTCGPRWALVSIAALKCHVWANYYAKRDMYDEFVVWHCLWHAVGVGSMMICYMVNGPIIGECWHGGWEDRAFAFANYFA